MRSGTDVGMSPTLQFHFIPEEFSGVGVRALSISINTRVFMELLVNRGLCTGASAFLRRFGSGEEKPLRHGTQRRSKHLPAFNFAGKKQNKTRLRTLQSHVTSEACVPREDLTTRIQNKPPSVCMNVTQKSVRWLQEP